MKVLHVMWSLEFGGIERLVLDHCRVQRQLGIDPSVLVASNQGRLASAFEEEGVPIHLVELRSGFDLRRDRIARAYEVMIDQSIVHLHCFTPAFARAAGKSAAPVVYTEHGNFGFGRPHTWKDRLKQIWKSRFVFQSVDFLSFNSDFTRECAAKRMKFPVEHRVVHNGIDLDRVGVRTGEILATLPADLSDRFVVGTSSRFAGFKRVDRLIRAFAMLKDTSGSYLLLVGDGPLRNDYERLANDLGIADRTLFTGFQANVADYQQVMDVCVFPSEGEPFGLVAVEALSLGKPTIVMSDGGGITEIVGSFSKDDVVAGEQGLADRLAQYQLAKRTSGDLLSVSQSESREKHANRFDIRNMAREFLEIYQAMGRGVEVGCA